MNATRSTTLAGPAASPAADRRAPRAVAAWLLVCCALVFAIVVVGGVTRLTHSGLSITEWQPIVGTLPPLSATQWDEAFVKYQATPEYRQINKGMSLDAFKSIFWWEYAHRLLGRVIGAAFALPLAWFVLRRRLPHGLAPPLVAIFALGGLQGALGWYMVQSASHWRPTSCWRRCCCNSRWASQRCCWSYLFRSPPRIRPAPCCCSPRRSTPRMRCTCAAGRNAREDNAHERICILSLQGGS
jgi:hypothetical protein